MRKMVSFGDIARYLLCAVIGACLAELPDLTEMSERLDAMLAGHQDEVTKWPKRVDGQLWSWHEYEPGTGVGNREGDGLMLGVFRAMKEAGVEGSSFRESDWRMLCCL